METQFMKSVTLYFFWLVLGLILGLQTGFAKGDDLFDLPADIRTELVKRAYVFRSDSPNSSEKMDVVELLKKECGFSYSRDADGKPVRPNIECTYLPRNPQNPFGGMMAKFDCQFQTSERSQVKTKVKYDPEHRPGGGYKEVPQAILGTLLTRLMGLEGNIYCPVNLTCLNCPSNDPWSQQKSQEPAIDGNRIEFKNVVIEKKLKGTKILMSNDNLPTHPKAFAFLNDLLVHLPGESRHLALAEREALAIWLNFIRHRDAGTYNMALNCQNRKDKASDKDTNSNAVRTPICQKISASINDFGNSFGYRSIDQKMELSRFRSAPGVRQMEMMMKFYTDGAGGSSNAAGFAVSEAGVKRFLQAIDQVTEQQLSDVLELAQIATVSDSSKEKWIEVFHKKIESIRQAGI